MTKSRSLRLMQLLNRNKWGDWRAQYQCYCGKVFITVRGRVRNYNTKSCGCLRELTGRKLGLSNIKHGHTSNNKMSPTYSTWHSMKQRCKDPNASNFERYGKRGIKICNTWLGENGYRSFLKDMGQRPKGKTIDRIDNQQGYSKNNCKWSTPKEQASNRRNSAIRNI